MSDALDHIVDDDFERLSEIYKLFGSVPRLKILIKLSHGEASATELCDAAGISQSATSHQLKELRSGRVIKSRKDGLNVFYSLDDSHIAKMLKSGIEHIKEENCHE